MKTRTFLRISLASVTLVLALGACGGATHSGDDAAPDPTPAAESAPAADPAADAVESGGGQLVARSDAEVAVFAQPGDASPSLTLPATTAFGSARALLVDTVDGDWLRVLLPTRPNGSTGWIRSDAVELRPVDEAIEVDLTARTLRLLVDGEVVVTTPAAVGTPDTPTPTGRFYVVDKLATGDPGHDYGPFALGLSGHGVLSEFAGGDGQIGIHGTNNPGSIGRAVSHGCVRVANDVITQLADLVPLGTPVVIS